MRGATVECCLRESYPGVVNDDTMTRLVQGAAGSLLGKDRVREIERPTMTTEDFGYYLMECPGTYYHIGAGCPHPLHSPRFLPDPGVAVTGAAVHAAVLWSFLHGGERDS